MFFDLPSKNKCEWSNIAPFVSQYNKQHNADYQLAECLDVKYRNKKVPEVLLMNSSDQAMVIERKTISWPTERFEALRLQEQLVDSIFDALRGEFSDKLYVLRIYLSSLDRGAYTKKHRKHWQSFSRRIVSDIQKHKEALLRGERIVSRNRVSWSFAPVSDEDWDLDEDRPKQGLGVVLHGGWEDLPFSWDDVEKFQAVIHTAREELRQDLDRIIESAKMKFRGYCGCERVLLIEPYGDVEIVLNDNGLDNLPMSADSEGKIDQVWVAQPDWISQNEYEVAYRRCV